MKENIISLSGSGWTAWQGRAVLTSERLIQHFPEGLRLVGILGMIPGSVRRFFAIRVQDQHGEVLCAVRPLATAEVCDLDESALRDWANLQILRFQAQNQPEAAIAEAA